MKTTIIYASIHHKNTEKIAKAMGEVLKTKPIFFSKIKKEEIEKSDLIGFGSGIYYAKFHKGLIKLIENLPEVKNKKAFIFSTAGIRKNIFLNKGNKHIKKLLIKKGFDVIGEWDCLGFDTNSFLKKIGGINKGRPNQNDIEKSKTFIKKILEK